GTGTFGRYGSYTEYITGNPDLLSAYLSQGSPEPQAWARWHWDTYGQYEDRPIGLRTPFAVGTNYVPYDMPATVHQGERIIPAADNRELMRRLSQPERSSQDIVAAIQRLEKRLDQIEAADRS